MEVLNCDFVFFTHAISGEKRKKFDSDWDGLYPRNVIIETIRSNLDSKSKVLCIERPVNLFTTPLTHFSKFRRCILRKDILRNIKENLFTYLPYTFMSDSLPIDFKLVTWINRKLLKRQLVKIMRKYKFESQKRIVWVYHPFHIDSLGLVKEDFVVFECHDEYVPSDKSIPDNLRNIIKRKEVELLKKADIVFVTSKLLYKNKSKYNRNTFYIPNAAHVEHFKKVQDPGVKESDRVKGIKKPIIGYLGTINNASNFELLTYVAGKRPDWSFVIIGPTESGYEKTTVYNRFKELPNVHLLGWVDYDDLPGVLKAFDVGVIPYKIDLEWNQNVNPNKLHEYTAMGKPIVSTDLPEVQSHRNIISIAHDKDEFIDLIEKSIQEDNKDKIMQRLMFAEENSWEKRVSEMLIIIKDMIGNSNETKS